MAWARRWATKKGAPTPNLVIRVGVLVCADYQMPEGLDKLAEESIKIKRSIIDTLSSQPWVREAQAHGYWDPMLSLTTSLLFAVVMLVLSARQLAQTDY